MEMRLKVSCTVTVPIPYMKKMQSHTHQLMLIIIVKSLQLISQSFSVKSNSLYLLSLRSISRKKEGWGDLYGKQSLNRHYGVIK